MKGISIKRREQLKNARAHAHSSRANLCEDPSFYKEPVRQPIPHHSPIEVIRFAFAVLVTGLSYSPVYEMRQHVL